MKVAGTPTSAAMIYCYTINMRVRLRIRLQYYLEQEPIA